MNQSILKNRNTVIANVVKMLEQDARIQLAFLLGSTKKGNITAASDIDLWVVLSEESGINTFRKELSASFAKVGALLGIYECTAHHYFIIFKSGVQLDLNLVTAASYWSLAGSKNGTVVFDRTLLRADKKTRTIKKHSADISRMLLIGYTTLERGVSKFLKRDYFVVVRFLDSVRHSSIIPLLPFFEKERIPNAVSLNLNNLSPEVKRLLVDTYANPTADSCRKSLRSSLELLDLIAKKVSIKDYNDYSIRLNKLIK